MIRRPAVPAVLVAIALIGAGCGGGGSPSPSGAITVRDAWARTSTSMELAGAVYLVIENSTGQADALTGAASPAAATVEIHQTVAGASGMMAMQPVDAVDLPAGETVTFEPGGYHIMLIGLSAPLEVGATLEITLTFEHAPSRTVTAEVRSS
jgi:hypothetical protein